MEPIRNKVAESGIVTLDLEQFIPADEQIAIFDLKPFLFMGMILKEKDYRAALLGHDWAQYRDKHTGIVCSADAIIPLWAYMLAASYLQPVAASLHYGDAAAVKQAATVDAIGRIGVQEYADKRVVLKGCGDKVIPEAAYIAATARLRPAARSLMYGEPCSTVPIYKKTVTTKTENV